MSRRTRTYENHRVPATATSTVSGPSYFFFQFFDHPPLVVMEKATATPSGIATGHESMCSSADSLPGAMIDIEGLNCANTECRDKLDALAAACYGPEPSPDAVACNSAREAFKKCITEASPPYTEEQPGTRADLL